MKKKLTGAAGQAALTLCACAVVFGAPLLVSGKLQTLVAGNTDAVSSASVVLAQPSGNYAVLMNRSLHDEDSRKEWAAFFEGGDFTYIFEDIACSVASGDTTAVEMAKSLQSQLPENQMIVQEEDSTLLLSRLDYGKYDVVVFSKEYAEAVGADLTAEDAYIFWIRDGGEEDEAS